MSVRKDGKIIAGTTVNPDLFDFKWADHILDDISWVRADTFSWQSGSLYTAMYNHLANDIQGKTSADLITETIGGVTIAYYLAADGHKIVEPDQEAAVISIYNTVGVAWYYIVDVENTRFKLPRTKFGFTGMRDSVGKYVAPGAPNITGNTHYIGACYNNGNVANYVDGVFSAFAAGNGGFAGGGGYGNAAGRLNFNASRSSSIYGASNTIQPPATQMYLYFYAGNYTPDAVAQTAGLNAELFNDKVDKGHQVIAFQAPTAQNNYTWYRKYADGWVEQGGMYDNGSAVADFNATITLPVPMRDTRYTANAIASRNTGSAGSRHGWTNIWTQSETQLSIGYYRGSSSETMRYMNWMVCGVAAS